jgi:uncharacterized protein YdgA (DUF945 family)
MQKKKVILGAVAAAVVLAGAHYGGATLIGPKVEDRFRAEIQRLDALDQRATIRVTGYQAGRLTSTAEVMVRPLAPESGTKGAKSKGEDPGPLPGIRFDVTLEHGPLLARLPLPFGAVGFEATAHPDEALRQALAGEIAPAPEADTTLLTVSGRGGFTGTVSGDFQSAPFSSRAVEEELSVDWGGMAGSFRADRDSLGLTANAPGGELREGSGNRFRLDDVHLEAEGTTTDGPYLLGRQSLSAGSMEALAPEGEIDIEGLMVTSHLEQEEAGLRIGFETEAAALGLRGRDLANPVDWTDVRMEAALTGVDAGAYGELASVVQDYPGEVPEAVLRGRVLPAVQTILAGHPRLTLDEARATNAEGTLKADGEASFREGARPDINRPRTVVEALDARFTLDAPAAAVEANLRRSLVSQGRSEEVAGRQAAMLVEALAADGYLKEASEDRYRTEITFRGSQLLVNGQPALGLMGVLMQ